MEFLSEMKKQKPERQKGENIRFDQVRMLIMIQIMAATDQQNSVYIQKFSSNNIRKTKANDGTRTTVIH